MNVWDVPIEIRSSTPVAPSSGVGTAPRGVSPAAVSVCAKRLLIVDDEELNRELLQGLVELLGHESEVACDGQEALDKLGPDIDLVLLDVMMPVMDGFEVARRIRQDPRYAQISDVPIIMVTALSGKQDRLCAVEAGANDFITKPIDKTELRVRTTSLLKMKEAQDALKSYQRSLEVMVEQRTRELRRALEDVARARQTASEAHLDTIHRLAMAAEYRDNDTAAHIHRVSHYCAVLGRALGLSEPDVDLLFHASAMHDIGKVGIPDSILLKPGDLSMEERDRINLHAAIGAQILGDSSSELLRAGEVIALAHHEKWDGSGYPKGLKGDEIPLYGRICAVADVFDALTSKRPYKEAFSPEYAFEVLREGHGSHFDPQILDLFFQNRDEILSIYEHYRD